MSSLSRIVSGSVVGTGRLSQSINHLSSTLIQLEEGLAKDISALTSTERLVRPFLTRSILEVGCTILIGRLDGFRLLTIAELQSQPSYNPAERAASAIQWTGDVLATNIPAKMWESGRKPAEMNRSLLGDYLDHVVLRPAATALIDYLSGQKPGMVFKPWTDELLLIEPESFVPRLRTTATALYSTASKGVHHEFVLSFASYYDDTTLAQLTEDAVKFLSTAALLVNFAECALFSLEPADALRCFQDIQV